MSRAINLSATEAEVADMCARHNVDISAIEKLQSGGTRVVLKNTDGTAVIAKAFRAKIINGPVTRVSYLGRTH